MLPSSIRKFIWLVDDPKSVIPRTQSEILQFSPYLQNWTDRVILASIKSTSFSPYYLVENPEAVVTWLQILPEHQRILCVEVEQDKPVAFYLDVDMEQKKRPNNILPDAHSVGQALIKLLLQFLGNHNMNIQDTTAIWMFQAHNPERKKISFHLHIPTLIFVDIEHLAAIVHAFRQYVITQIQQKQQDALHLEIVPNTSSTTDIECCIDRGVYHHHRAIRLPFCHKPDKPNLVYDNSFRKQQNVLPTIREQILAALPHYQPPGIVRIQAPSHLLQTYLETKKTPKKKGIKRKADEIMPDNQLSGSDYFQNALQSSPLVPFLTLSIPMKPIYISTNLSNFLLQYKYQEKNNTTHAPLPVNVNAMCGKIHGGRFVIPSTSFIELVQLSYHTPVQCNSLTEIRSPISAMALDFELYFQDYYFNPFIPGTKQQPSVTRIIQETILSCFPRAQIECTVCQASGIDTRKQTNKSSYRFVWPNICHTVDVQRQCAQFIKKNILREWGPTIADGVDLSIYQSNKPVSRFLYNDKVKQTHELKCPNYKTWTRTPCSQTCKLVWENRPLVPLTLLNEIGDPLSSSEPYDFDKFAQQTFTRRHENTPLTPINTDLLLFVNTQMNTTNYETTVMNNDDPRYAKLATIHIPGHHGPLSIQKIKILHNDNYLMNICEGQPCFHKALKLGLTECIEKDGEVTKYIRRDQLDSSIHAHASQQLRVTPQEIILTCFSSTCNDNSGTMMDSFCQRNSKGNLQISYPLPLNMKLQLFPENKNKEPEESKNSNSNYKKTSGCLFETLKSYVSQNTNTNGLQSKILKDSNLLNKWPNHILLAAKRKPTAEIFQYYIAENAPVAIQEVKKVTAVNHGWYTLAENERPVSLYLEICTPTLLPHESPHSNIPHAQLHACLTHLQKFAQQCQFAFNVYASVWIFIPNVNSQQGNSPLTSEQLPPHHRYSLRFPEVVFTNLQSLRTFVQGFCEYIQDQANGADDLALLLIQNSMNRKSSYVNAKIYNESYHLPLSDGVHFIFEKTLNPTRLHVTADQILIVSFPHQPVANNTEPLQLTTSQLKHRYKPQWQRALQPLHKATRITNGGSFETQHTVTDAMNLGINLLSKVCNQDFASKVGQALKINHDSQDQNTITGASLTIRQSTHQPCILGDFHTVPSLASIEVNGKDIRAKCTHKSCLVRDEVRLLCHRTKNLKMTKFEEEGERWDPQCDNDVQPDETYYNSTVLDILQLDVEYLRQHTALAIWAKCSRGKTKWVTERLRELLQMKPFQRIIWLSTRQVYADEIQNVLSSLGFVSYRSYHSRREYQILAKQRLIIISPESLPKLLQAASELGIDLISELQIVVADETSELSRIPTSETVSTYRYAAWSALQQVLSAPNANVIALDADYSQTTHQWLRSILGRRIHVIRHDPSDYQARKYCWYTHAAVWFQRFQYELKGHSKKIALVNTGRQSLHRICDGLESEIRCLRIDQDTPKDQVREFLSRLSNGEMNYDLVAFTPTICCGNDMSGVTFDEMFAFSTNLSVTPGQFHQMMWRLRKLKGRVHIYTESYNCLDLKPLTVTAMTRFVLQNANYFKEYAELIQLPAPPEQVNEAMRAAVINRFLEKSRGELYFDEVLLNIILRNGDEVMVCDTTPTPLQQKTYERIRETLDPRIEKIVEAPNIDFSCQLQLYQQAANRNNTTDTEKRALEKYWLAKTYGIRTRQIDVPFVTHFGDIQKQTQFRSLKHLHLGYDAVMRKHLEAKNKQQGIACEPEWPEILNDRHPRRIKTTETLLGLLKFPYVRYEAVSELPLPQAAVALFTQQSNSWKLTPELANTLCTDSDKGWSTFLASDDAQQTIGANILQRTEKDKTDFKFVCRITRAALNPFGLHLRKLKRRPLYKGQKMSEFCISISGYAKSKGWQDLIPLWNLDNPSEEDDAENPMQVE